MSVSENYLEELLARNQEIVIDRPNTEDVEGEGDEDLEGDEDSYSDMEGEGDMDGEGNEDNGDMEGEGDEDNSGDMEGEGDEDPFEDLKGEGDPDEEKSNKDITPEEDNDEEYELQADDDDNINISTERNDDDKEMASKPKKKPKTENKNPNNEYGVSRGIDFQVVANVVNFDFPKTVQGYIHRVGRTARADKTGAALSFVGETDLEVLEEVKKYQESKGDTILPHKFKMTLVEGFRYRAEGVLGSITKRSIKLARIAEIKSEFLNSQALKAHFEHNPNDRLALKHDKVLQRKVVKRHLKNIPFYLIPQEKVTPLTPLGNLGQKRKAKKQKT